MFSNTLENTSRIRILLLAIVATFALSACSTTGELNASNQAFTDAQMQHIDTMHGLTAAVDPNKCHYRRC